MYIVGGHGYVGSRVLSYAAAEGHHAGVVSREGDTRRRVPSIAWPDFLADLADRGGRTAPIVWILDGTKHDELNRLNELLAVAETSAYVAAVSSCTVYGDQLGQACDERTPLSLRTPNAELKAACEAALDASGAPHGVLRLGALYGIDDRGVRRDRVEKWVTEAVRDQTVTIPDPSHWRGWLHRDQAARALLRAAQQRVEGIYNVTTSNYRSGDAAAFAAEPFGATVVSDGNDDPLNYQIDSTRATELGLLDQQAGEDLKSSIDAFAAKYAPQ